MNLSTEIISKAIKSVIDGEESACEVYAMLKNLSSQIASGLELIKDEAMTEARMFNKGEVNFGGIWEFRSSQTYLNFAEDETFVNLNSALSERKKELNNAWKANQSGKGFFDNNSGEQIPVLSVKTEAKEGLIFKAK